jgi:hypothetical protein
MSYHHSGGDFVQNINGVRTSLLKETTGHATVVNQVTIFVLYAALPPEAQMLAFQPKPPGCQRKIILATNFAGFWAPWMGFDTSSILENKKRDFIPLLLVTV